MKTIEIDCFVLLTADGGGMDNTQTGFASSETVAREWVGKSGFRSFSPYKKTYYIIDSIEELNDLETIKKRQRALAKLTDEDKKALGL